MKTKGFLFSFVTLVTFVLSSLALSAQTMQERFPNPFRYDFKFDYSLDYSDHGDTIYGYLVYKNPLISSQDSSPKEIILDSLILLQDIKTTFATERYKRMVSEIYFTEEEKKILVYINTKTIRGKKLRTWSAKFLVVNYIYGKKTGNVIFLKEEIKRQRIGNKWNGPLIYLSLIILCSVLSFLQHRRQIKKYGETEKSHDWEGLLVLLAFFSICASLIMWNPISILFYGLVFGFFFCLQLFLVKKFSPIWKESFHKNFHK